MDPVTTHLWSHLHRLTGSCGWVGRASGVLQGVGVCPILIFIQNLNANHYTEVTEVPSHKICSHIHVKPKILTTSPRPTSQCPKGSFLCRLPLLSSELALITILLIALNSAALLPSIGNAWPWLLKQGILLGSLIKAAGRHLPTFIHNIFILIYWQRSENLAPMLHQLDFIKKIRELSW